MDDLLDDIRLDSAYANGMSAVLAAWAPGLTGETPENFKRMHDAWMQRRREIAAAKAERNR
jgi:hypothetical protein